MYAAHDGLDPDERAELALEDLVLADLPEAAQPRAPSSPSPGGAWRSRLEPSGVCESFR